MKIMYPNFRTALREYLRVRGIKHKDLADRLDANPVTISKLINGRMGMTEAWMDRIAAELGTTVRDIWDGSAAADAVVGSKPETATEKKGRIDRADMYSEAERKTLPVYGLAAASPLGQMVMSEDPIEWIEPPGIVARVPDAYSLIITGTSMIPRYEPGDMIILHPHRPVRQNDHVAIQEIKEGGTHVSVKRFDRMDGDHIVTMQYNPPAEVRFRRDQVVAMHRILTPNEVLGV